MKKVLALALALCLMLGLCACGEAEMIQALSDKADEVSAAIDDYAAVRSAAAEVAVTPMTYAEYMAADMDTEVNVLVYVQDHQSWWDNTITVYAADEDGAYFLYNMACSEEDAEALVPGTAILVNGWKSEWSGEVEIVDATFTFAEGSYIAPALEATELLGTEELVDHQNEYAAFRGMTVESEPIYKWDGSGEDGDDLYFDVSYNGEIYNFTVESYLRGAGTEVYEAVKTLQVGDVIDLRGYLYWYEGVNPHITYVGATKPEGTMTHEEYVAASVDTEVNVLVYVQDHQSWWDNTITVYAADEDGAYFLYNMACSEEDAEALVPGTAILVNGWKSEWSGEVEIVDATFTFAEGEYVAEALDVTELLGTDELIDHQNEFVSFAGLTVESEPLYKWDGSGEDGDDLYFDVSYNGEIYNFTVESYLRGAGTEVYESVKDLQVGDVVNLEGFLYWYEGVNPHIISVEVVG